MFNIHSMKKIMRRLKKKSKNPKKNSSKVLTNQHIFVRITRVIRTFFSQFWRKSCIIFKNHENVKKNTSDLNFSVIFQITFQPDSALEIRSPSFTKGTFSPSWKWDEGDDEGVPFVPFVYTSLCLTLPEMENAHFFLPRTNRVCPKSAFWLVKTKISKMTRCLLEWQGIDTVMLTSQNIFRSIPYAYDESGRLW